MKVPTASDPASFNHRFVTVTSGHRYHLIDQHPPDWVGPITDAPTLLLCHGFPDTWFGWRIQIIEFVQRGWRVLCPSQLGYNETSTPSDPAKYSFRSVAYDMNSLLDECGVKHKAVILGHDWGGLVAWRFANYFPHRCIAVATVCTPYNPPLPAGTPFIPDEQFIRKFAPNFGYQLFFSKPGTGEKLDYIVDQFLQPMHSPNYRRAARGKRDDSGFTFKEEMWVKEGKLEASVENLIQARKAGKLPPAPGEPELDYYVQAYKKSGCQAPLNWYRTRYYNWKEETEANLPQQLPGNLPCLFLPATLDAALPPALSKNMGKYFPEGNLHVHTLEGADHWCLQDEAQREEPTRILGDWIEKVLSGKWQPEACEKSRL